MNNPSVAEEFKLGVVQNQVVQGIIPREDHQVKLGVVTADPDAHAITHPGLGVVVQRPSFSQEEQVSQLHQLDQSRFFQIKRIWQGMKGNPNIDGLLGQLAQEVYGMLLLPPPRVYRFSSPLAAMLAIPHIGALHGINVEAHNHPLSQFRDALSIHIGAVDEGWHRRMDLNNDISKEMHRLVRSLINAKFLDRFTDQLTGVIGPLEKSIRLFEKIEPSVLSWWNNIRNSECWWWPYRTFLVVSDDPTIHLDDEGRGHREDGHAVEFADGYGLYYIHGFSVPEKVVLHPEELSIEEIEDEKNAEVRRIMIERLGPGNYLKRCDAQVVDIDTLTLEGSATRALMVDRRGHKWLVGTDGSTARVYTMPVPDWVKSCRQAHESISGFEESRLIAEA